MRPESVRRVACLVARIRRERRASCRSRAVHSASELYLLRRPTRTVARFALLKLEDVTFVILTKDEAENLPRALESVPLEARLLILDAFSCDATVAIARARGAEIIERGWDGFVKARRFALGCVRTPWTFMLDADEALDADAVAALRRAEPDDQTGGYTFARATYFCGKPMRGGAWGREAPLRLFRTHSAQLAPHPAGGGSADVHESWSVPGRVARLPGVLHHHSYPTLATYRAKFARYTALEARGVNASWARALRAATLAVARVPWLLIVRGGWRDGWRGAFVAVASAAYPVFVAVKALRS